MMENVQEYDDIMLMYEFIEKAVEESPENNRVYQAYMADTGGAASWEDWLKAADKVKQHPFFGQSEYMQLLVSQAMVNASAGSPDFQNALKMADSLTQLPLFDKSGFIRREYATALANTASLSKNKENGEDIIRGFSEIPPQERTMSVQYFYAMALGNILRHDESQEEMRNLLQLIRSLPAFNESEEIRQIYAESLKNIAFNVGVDISVDEGKKIADEITLIPGYEESGKIRMEYALALLGLMEELDSEELKPEFLAAITQIPGFSKSESIQYEYAMGINGSIKSGHSAVDIMELLDKIEDLPLLESSGVLNAEYLRCLTKYGYALARENNSDEKQWEKIFHQFDASINSPRLTVFAKCDVTVMWLTFYEELLEKISGGLPDFLKFDFFLSKLERWMSMMKESLLYEDFEMFPSTVKYAAENLGEDESKKIEAMIIKYEQETGVEA